MPPDTTPDPEAASCTCTPGMCSRGDFRDHQGESPGCMSCADLDPDQPCYAGPTRGDPVAAYLAETRERVRQRDALVARLAVAAVGAQEFNTAQDRLAERTAPLAAALGVALSSHPRLPEGGPTGGAWCPTCWRIWPCETYRAIRAELLGETGTEGTGEERYV